MYLKQIKIYGFKSFADKIEIDLCPNINGIVGPNGSGKSNIIDAVRWVLGEQSIKSLRGENSQDIIFSGSKSRKPLNNAYVSLVFDNTDKSLPIDYNEVSVKRVMYRTGETEYFLNNERCRLKDINDLLTDSGASKESFNIISQGKIDEILRAKPTERRSIIESAAGVIKYKKRKEEAIKKLDRTNQNINRVNDIISELETNLGPLEEQSKSALKYLEVQKSLKNIEISLITHDVEDYTYQVKEDTIALDKLNDELASLSSNSASYDIELLKEKNALKEIEEHINENQNKLITITKKIENIDADIRVLKERKKYTESANNIKDNILALKDKELNYQNLYNQTKNNLELESTKFDNKENQISSLSTKINKDKLALKELETTLNKNNREITNIKYRIEYLENSINNNASMPNSIKSILNNPRFTFVHNTIGNLIEVEDKYSLALSIALGGATNYLVVNSSNDAKELVNYLKNNNLGRATFFPLEVIKPRYIDSNTIDIIKESDLFINTLDKLITYDNKYENIIKNQLGNVIVVNNIEDANIISKKINHKYKVVTLDGQVVNVGGSVTGGSNNKSNNIIKEKYELDENKKKLETINTKNIEINKQIKDLETEISTYVENVYQYKMELKEIEFTKNKVSSSLEEINKTLYEITRELKDLNSISNLTADDEETKLLTSLYQAKEEKDNILTNINKYKLEKYSKEQNIEEKEELNKKSNNYINIKEKTAKELELKLNTMNMKIDNLLLNLSEDYNMTFEHAKERYKLEMDADSARELVKEYKQELKKIGYVNVGAIEEYKRVKERYDFLDSQKNDLKNAEDTLLEIINEMDEIMIDKFSKTFEAVRIEFKNVFREMFHGGDAELTLTDPDNLLETGIDLMAVPSGKTMKSLSLLSGGEKTFTAISLLFAILNIRPVPFCLLDEVEAALDDANVESFGTYLDKYRDKTQFILITHKKKTMEFANTLYGITMQESGVSKLVSVKLEEIEKNKDLEK